MTGQQSPAVRLRQVESRKHWGTKSPHMTERDLEMTGFVRWVLKPRHMDLLNFIKDLQ